MNQEIFYNQSWFWAGFFTAFASIGGIFVKEWLSRSSQLKVEKLKLYESDIFKAYCKLHEFASSALISLWPPNDPRLDFMICMQIEYFKNIKINKLFYDSRVREILSKFESQYHCLSDPDLIPEKTFNDFYQKDLSDLLIELQKIVEEKTNGILQH